jgi:sulfide:quinone oxidoreductase
MDLHAIDDGLSVTGQIAPADLPEIAAHGFRVLICNRPDGEAADQPTQGAIAAAAPASGLAFRYLPIVAGRVDDDDTAAFGAARRALPGPVLAYCRTGTRSATLWSLAEASRRPLPVTGCGPAASARSKCGS